MSTACGRPQGGGGDPAHVGLCGQRGGGSKTWFFCGHHKWMALYALRFAPVPVEFPPILQVPQLFSDVPICSYTKFSSPYQNVTFASP